MEQIKVWTKQHENVLKELNENGRYIARREYIRSDLQEHAGLVLEVYDWLVMHRADAAREAHALAQSGRGQEARGCGVSGMGFIYQ